MSNEYQIEFPCYIREKKITAEEKANGEKAGEYLVCSPNFPANVNLKDVFFIIFFDQEYPKMVVRSTAAPARKKPETAEDND